MKELTEEDLRGMLEEQIRFQGNLAYDLALSNDDGVTISLSEVKRV